MFLFYIDDKGVLDNQAASKQGRCTEI